jgi:hypothetical protein
MKKFLQIYGGIFLALPIAFCVVLYSIGCFVTWSIPPVNIEWGIVRVYMIFSLIFALFLTLDKDL